MKNKLIQYKKGSSVQVRIGDILDTPYTEPAELISVYFVTNGVANPTIVAVFTVEFSNASANCYIKSFHLCYRTNIFGRLNSFLWNKK